MTLYTVLDAVADSVNWGLLLIVLGSLLHDGLTRRWRRLSTGVAALLGCIAIVYGIRHLDGVCRADAVPALPRHRRYRLVGVVCGRVGVDRAARARDVRPWHVGRDGSPFTQRGFT